MKSTVNYPVANVIPFGAYGKADFGSRQIPVFGYATATAKVFTLAGSSGKNLVSTSHGLTMPGDFIRFTSGALVGKEFFINSFPDANTIEVNYSFLASELPANGVTFNVYRAITPSIDSSGNVNYTGPALGLVFKHRHNYSSVNVTSAAYVELISSITANVKKVQIFDSSGVSLLFATGAAASESDQFYIFPGGNGDLDITLTLGQRLSIKAVDGSATVGELLMNFIA
jgi:hypothetical protein